MKSYSIILFSVICLLAVQPAYAGEWPIYHGDSSLTGSSETELPANPVRKWRTKIGSTVAGTPVSCGKRIYCADEKGTVSALDMEGKLLWTAPAVSNGTFAAPAVCIEETVVIGSDEGMVMAFKADTGKLIWSYNSEDTIMGSVNWARTKKGTYIILIGQSQGSIHCLDIKTGNLVWKIGSTNRCDGSPAVAEGTIAFGNCDAALHTFSVLDGKRGQEIKLGEEGQVAGGVSVYKGQIFAGTQGRTLVSADMDKGKTTWVFRNADGTISSTPAVRRGTVLFTTDYGTLYALGRTSGKLKWKLDLDGSPGSPVIAGTRSIVSVDGSIVMIDMKKGKQLWKKEISDDITSPAIINGMIVVGSDDGHIWAFGKK